MNEFLVNLKVPGMVALIVGVVWATAQMAGEDPRFDVAGPMRAPGAGITVVDERIESPLTDSGGEARVEAGAE
jgi:hypothetical protein